MEHALAVSHVVTRQFRVCEGSSEQPQLPAAHLPSLTCGVPRYLQANAHDNLSLTTLRLAPT